MARLVLFATVLSILLGLVAVDAELKLTPNELVCNANSPADEGYISFCHGVIQCPSSCPQCELSCKYCGMKNCPRCNTVGSVCEDPRFIGGDGVMFYFHGLKDKDFCIVSDEGLHINAHFIGKRTEGRPRDFTWVQALGIMFGKHKLYIGARRVARWEAEADQFVIYYDGAAVEVAEGTGQEWEAKEGGAKLRRSEDWNAYEVEVAGLMKARVKIVPVTAEESRVHKYGMTEEDCLAHLEINFDTLHLSDGVSGVLGQTYAPGFVNPVKRGVPMPVMGGESNFLASSIFSPDCRASRFRSSSLSSALLLPRTSVGLNVKCGSDGAHGSGLVCRK